jgi:tripartite-type tricarboxylate transporter receptor subunit TctC
MKKRLDALFVDQLIQRQPEFAALVKADAVKWERLVREAGIKIE